MFSFHAAVILALVMAYGTSIIAAGLSAASPNFMVAQDKVSFTYDPSTSTQNNQNNAMRPLMQLN